MGRDSSRMKYPFGYVHIAYDFSVSVAGRVYTNRALQLNFILIKFEQICFV